KEPAAAIADDFPGIIVLYEAAAVFFVITQRQGPRRRCARSELAIADLGIESLLRTVSTLVFLLDNDCHHHPGHGVRPAMVVGIAVIIGGRIALKQDALFFASRILPNRPELIDFMIFLACVSEDRARALRPTVFDPCPECEEYRQGPGGRRRTPWQAFYGRIVKVTLSQQRAGPKQNQECNTDDQDGEDQCEHGNPGEHNKGVRNQR